MRTTATRGSKRTGSIDHNLPIAPTSLVGRSREIAEISDGLRKTRLLTLTGPGGVGKTRLALELAHRSVARRADGVWLVDLALGSETPDVAAETARTLGVGSTAGTTPTDALCAYLATRDLLLMLDNCEHVIEACAKLAAALLASCPDVGIIATSRDVLGLAGETVWRLEPLAPQDAYRLFVERAKQQQPDFLPKEETEAAIANLCERLDRLPLAIELAAARVGAMSPAEILSALDAHLVELGSERRFSPPHQRTVRAMVQWSYELLSPSEQEAFRSLAVFVRGFDASAARSVAQGLSLDALARLVDKSLVAFLPSRKAKSRYRLLETVREYAHERLTQAGELDAARERHLRYFSAFADTARDGWPSSDALRTVSALEDDYENVRAAVEFAAVENPCSARELFAGLKDLFMLLGDNDGRRLAKTLLERCPNRDRYRAEVEISAGLLGTQVGDGQTATQALTEARELSAELGEQALEGWASFCLGLTDTLGGAIGRGRSHLERCIALHSELGIRTGEARAKALLGLGYLQENEPAHGRELVEEALAINDSIDDDWGRGQCHLYLGIIAETSGGGLSHASRHFRQAVELLRPYRGILLPVALIEQAGVLAHHDPARALQVAAAAWSIRSRTGGRILPFYQARAARTRKAAEHAVGDDAPRLWRDGERLTIDDAIALAFGAGKPHSDIPAGLSARESEVARLVAQGLSNRAIGLRLHLSVRTVESHVRRTLMKLALENRTQLATWARERIQ